MLIKVQPLTGFKQSLLYRLGEPFNTQNLVGTMVEVPLRSRTIHALVIEQGEHLADHVSYPVRDILAISAIPYDKHYHTFLTSLATYYHLEPIQLLKRLYGFLTIHPQPDNNQQPEHVVIPIISLTHEQQQVCTAIKSSIQSKNPIPTVLHGVTGSGKSEIYKNLICSVHAQGKTTIVMVPEVSLAIQCCSLFKHTLPSNIPIVDFHSATTNKSKQRLWHELIKKTPLVIIGVHQPIMLPITNLGLIIIDEEHEPGYQEKRHPKINSKEAALIRAHQYAIPIILGSATPSISSLYNVEKRNWNLVKLTQRYRGNFPSIEVVYLTEKKEGRRNFWISRELDQAIKDRLKQREQIIIFLNRRGYSFFVQCSQCAQVFTCPHCAVSLTLHEHDRLCCHYCGTQKKLPQKCPSCSKNTFIKKGIGTQQVVGILEHLFPEARIARADLDTTRKKRIWQQTLNDFNAGALDILVGTQTITKGYHFRSVTLVGVLWADLNLHFPQFNAAETTVQQLIQVAGRAGREQEHSHVIVQAMARHNIFNALNEVDYISYYNQELLHRQLLAYPPCGRLCEIELSHTNESTVATESCRIAYCMQQLHIPTLTVLGPATPPIAKIKNIHRRTIYLKAPSFTTINTAYNTIKATQYASSIHYTPIT